MTNIKDTNPVTDSNLFLDSCGTNYFSYHYGLNYGDVEH